MSRGFFSLNFRTDNSANLFYVTTHFQECENCYYNIIMSDDKDTIYYPANIKNGFWYRFDFDKVFRYNVKMLQFDGDNVKKIDEKYFSLKEHNFNIFLKSDDEKEIKFWKDYLLIMQLKFNTKFNIIHKYVSLENQIGDYVEISRDAYDIFLKKSYNSLTDDYSSLTIIRSLFNVVEDDSEIINHPWLR